MVAELKSLLAEIRSKQSSFTTNEDVGKVLSLIAPPGEKRELKKQVISELFTSKSPQGYTTADTLDSYGEY